MMERYLKIFIILQSALPNSSSATATVVQNDDAESSSGSESGSNGDEASGSLSNEDISTQTGHDVVDVDIRYERMYRHAHGCPGPPSLHTDLPLAIGPDFSLEHMRLQDDLQREAVTGPSDPPGQQGGLSSPNEVERSVPILYFTTLNTPSNSQECSQSYNKPARHNISNELMCSDKLFTQIEYLPLKLRQELDHPQRPFLSHVPDNSVPDQDQQPSNDCNQQPTVRGAESEVREDDVHHTKTQKKEKEKNLTSMPIIGRKGEKQVKFSDDVKIDNADESFKDVKDFIKQFVKQELGSKKSDIKRVYDAVIVYDKTDYEYAVEMRDTIQAIVLKELNEELRIELFDGEIFVQSHVQVVQDVLKNTSVVLIYLSKNTENSGRIQFFIEEAIALTRIFPIDRDGLGSEFSVRPVHSQPPNRRNYRTPTGLVSVSGIDWYNRSSRYTYDRIVAIMKNAIRRRKLIENPRPYHGREDHQFAVASTSATSGEQYTHPAPITTWYTRISEPTQYEINCRSTENMMRRMSLEPTQGSAGSSYTHGGNHIRRTVEGYTQPELCHVYENINSSFTPYAELVAPVGVQQNPSTPTRPLGTDLGYRPAEEPEFRGYHRMGQLSRVEENSCFPRQSQMPLIEQPQYSREGRDEKHAMGLANNGQRINTSRTNFRNANGYGALNEPRPGHSAMHQAPGVRQQRPTAYSPGHLQQQTHPAMGLANDGLRTQTSRIYSRTADGYSAMIQPHPGQPTMQMAQSVRQQRPIEYSPGPMQQQTLQELQQQQHQQQQPPGQIDMGGTSEVLDSNLSTNDLEIDYPTSSQESRRMYDQGPADNVYTADSDSSEDESLDLVPTSDDMLDADLFDNSRHDRQNVGRTVFTSRTATSFSDLVNRSLVIEYETCDPANVSDVD